MGLKGLMGATFEGSEQFYLLGLNERVSVPFQSTDQDKDNRWKYAYNIASFPGHATPPRKISGLVQSSKFKVHV